jgi:hypothetical protein
MQEIPCKSATNVLRRRQTIRVCTVLKWAKRGRFAYVALSQSLGWLPLDKDYRWRDDDLQLITLRSKKHHDRLAVRVAKSFDAQDSRATSIEVQAPQYCQIATFTVNI